MKITKHKFVGLVAIVVGIYLLYRFFNSGVV